MCWLWPALLGAALSLAWGEEEEGSCQAAGSCGSAGAAAGDYHWPNVRGLSGQYGVSNLTAPKDLSKPSWRWHHPKGQYHAVVVGGPVIDHEKNLYFSEMTGLRKMSPDGHVIWSAEPPPGSFFPDGPSIHAGGVFQTTTSGQLCRFAMDTGRLTWCQKYYPSVGPDSKYVTSHDGIVIIGVDDPGGGGSKHVLGIHSESGKLLWDFAPDTPTWNNMGMYTEDDTVVLQDWDAKVYRLGLHNGSLLWKSGGHGGKTWTDGGTIIGANGIVYSAFSQGGQKKASSTFQGGGASAYRLSDGQHLWTHTMKHGVFTWPVAGRLHGDERWTVVIAAGGIPPCTPWKAIVLMVASGKAIEFLVYGVLLEVGLALCWKRWRCRGSLWRFALALLIGSVVGCVQSARYINTIPSFPFEITAVDADTGRVRWHYDGPVWERIAARGDEEGFWARMATPWRSVCCPASFGSPTVDGNGVVYIGHVSGLLYAIKDWNDDGRIDDSEVQTFDAEAAFLHSGPAFAPGLFAFSTCDSVWVWKT